MIIRIVVATLLIAGGMNLGYWWTTGISSMGMVAVICGLILLMLDWIYFE